MQLTRLGKTRLARTRLSKYLARHQQNLPNLVSLTLDRDCYPGDEGFASLRKLRLGTSYSSISDLVSNLRAVEEDQLKRQAEIIPRHRSLARLEHISSPDTRYTNNQCTHAHVTPRPLLEVILLAPCLTTMELGGEVWTIRTYKCPGVQRHLLHICVFRHGCAHLRSDMTAYRDRTVPSAIMEMAYARAGLDFHAKGEGVRGAVLPTSAWDLLDEWVDSTDPGLDTTSCALCRSSHIPDY